MDLKLYTDAGITRALQHHYEEGRIHRFAYLGTGKWRVSGIGGTHPNEEVFNKSEAGSLCFGLASASFKDA